MDKLKILVVDDEEMLRDIYEIILTGSIPCDIITAANGIEAIKELEESKHSNKNFDLIISDFGMPKLNGAGILRHNAQSDNIPLFIISGGELEDYAELKDLIQINPLNKFISKPFDENDLLREVRDLIFKINKNAILNDQSSKKNNDDFVQINLNLLMKYSHNSSEVYLNINENKFIKIIDQNIDNLPDLDLLQHYLSRGIQYVYMKKIHFYEVIKDSIQKLRASIKLKNPVNEILEISGLQFHISFSALNSIGITTIQIEEISNVIEDVINEISKDKISLLYLKKFFRKEEFLIGHSILIMFVAAGICKKTELPFTSTLKKICLASFFHDFSLYDSNCSQHEIKFNMIEDDKILQKIIEHPIASANFLPPISDVIEDTKRIILEHHECPNGEGYPKKINAFQIAPLSCLFIIAQQMTLCLLRNDFDKSRLKDFLVNNEIIYNQGNFAKFYKAALKKYINEQK